MANELDEMTGPVNGAGRDISVIEKQLPVRVGWGSAFFEIVLWCLCIIPGLIFLFMKISARNYFQKLQQKIQADASTIDNYLEQRVQILQNLAALVEKAIDLDKDVMKAVAAFRGGRLSDSTRNAVANEIGVSAGSSHRWRRILISRPTPPLLTRFSRTVIFRRRSRPPGNCTMIPSCSGTPTSLTGRRSRSSRHARDTRRAFRSRLPPRSRHGRGERSFDRGRLRAACALP